MASKIEEFYEALKERAARDNIGIVPVWQEDHYEFEVYSIDPHEIEELQASINKGDLAGLPAKKSERLASMKKKVNKEYFAAESDKIGLSKLREAAESALLSEGPDGNEVNGYAKVLKEARDQQQVFKKMGMPMEPEMGIVQEWPLKSGVTLQPIEGKPSVDSRTTRDPEPTTDESEASQPEADGLEEKEDATGGAAATTPPRPPGAAFLPHQKTSPPQSATFLPKDPTEGQFRFLDLVGNPNNWQFWGEPYRVVTDPRAKSEPSHSILQSRGVDDLKYNQREGLSRILMLTHSDPFAVFIPMWKASIDERTIFRKQFAHPDPQYGEITIAHIEEANKRLLGDRRKSNWGLTEELNSVHPNMAEYIYAVLKLQAATHETNPLQQALAKSDGASSFLQHFDIGGMFENQLSYLRAGMQGVLQQNLFYNGIDPKEDYQNRKFTVTYDNNGQEEELFSGHATKVPGADSYKMTLTLSGKLSDDLFAKALRQAMVFNAQYCQHSRNNTLMIKKFGNNPMRSLMILYMANQFDLHIPQAVIPKRDQIESQFNDMFPDDPGRVQELMKLWDWYADRAQLVHDKFVGDKRVFSHNLDPEQVALKQLKLYDTDTKTIVIDPYASNFDPVTMISLKEAGRLKMEEAFESNLIKVNKEDMLGNKAGMGNP